MVKAFADDVVVRHGRATLLINNAGVSLHGNFDEISIDDIRWLMGINWARCRGLVAILPTLSSKSGRTSRIVERVFGLVGPAAGRPPMPSKFAVGDSYRSAAARVGGTVECLRVSRGCADCYREEGETGRSASGQRRGGGELDQVANSSPEQAAERILHREWNAGSRES